MAFQFAIKDFFFSLESHFYLLGGLEHLPDVLDDDLHLGLVEEGRALALASVVADHAPKQKPILMT